MKAIIYRRYGPPEVLQFADIDIPAPRADEVFIQIKAASVNPIDWHFMRGTPFFLRLMFGGLLKPKVVRLGRDVAGVVEAVGNNVDDFKPGDSVYGTCTGAFAQYGCAVASKLALKPANMTFAQAASAPIAGITALQALRDKAQLQSGQQILINGAAGGVGMFAVQIAKAIGANVTAVCSTKSVGVVRSIGADRVIDYAQEDFTRSERRFDAILDMVGNHSVSNMKGVLTTEGVLVQAGSKTVSLAGMLFDAVAHRFGRQKVVTFMANMNHADLETLRHLMESGRVTPVIERTYPLCETATAIRHMEEGHARGKTVIAIDD